MIWQEKLLFSTLKVKVSVVNKIVFYYCVRVNEQKLLGSNFPKSCSNIKDSCHSNSISHKINTNN